MNQSKNRMAAVVATLLLAFLLTISGGGSALLAMPLEQSAGTVNRTSNVRSGPSVDFDVMDVFTEGQAVEVTGVSADGTWYALSGGQWIAAFLVDGVEGASSLPVMTADDTMMSDDSDEAATEEAAEETAAEEPAAEAATEEATEEAAPAEPVAPADTGAAYQAVISTNGNLRAGPSTLYDVVSGVPEGATVTLVGQTPYGNWFQLDSGEWVSISLIANPPGPLPYVTPDPSNTESGGGEVVAEEEAADEEAMEEEAADEEAMEEEAADEEAMEEEAADEEAMEEEAADEEAMEEEAADEEAVEEEAADEEAMEEEAADEEAMEEDAADEEEVAMPEATPAPEPAPEPQVTIPSGWTTLTDAPRGYSVSVPPGWSELDLRGQQFAQLATTFGQGAAVADLQTFLATEEGESVGVVAITDIANTFFGGLPTLLNVSIIEAVGVTPELLVDYIEQVLELNAAMLGDVNIDDISATTINNLPAVAGSGTGDLSNVGVNAQAAVKVAALIYNDRIYMITLGTQLSNWANAEPVFDQIIGTLKPE